ncbi:uncharacterized protein [Spinacia oleracea]|uniref:Uncharacterized protein LOC110783787 isoform X1 n=1 Tax=Spinacia oleracea TaxID=3562 RepID=A0A9R0JRF0_SPIOL|nr:uncharacterized protein LOC110783787 isoform X1 [Spinacia oleracea]XP_021843847.1 uncharacterized protein LOC110783787 isoform X1 [Spinacia oleracea]XP_021843848.1 uncharacterized protein LOC110783787 isoform X1 [Spinacia oleracea]
MLELLNQAYYVTTTGELARMDLQGQSKPSFFWLFNDQKKSKVEINVEFQISDEEDARDGHLGSKGSGLGQSIAFQSSTWMFMKSNLFLHRSGKAQTVDEV